MTTQLSTTHLAQLKQDNKEINFFLKNGKECKVCNQTYPFKTDFWRTSGGGRSGRNLSYICQVCKKNDALKRIELIEEKEQNKISDIIKKAFMSGLQINGYKFCIKCGELKEENYRSFDHEGKGLVCNDCCHKSGLSHKELKIKVIKKNKLRFCSVCGVQYKNNSDYFHKDSKGTCKKCVSYRIFFKKEKQRYPDEIRKKISYYLIKVNQEKQIGSVICNGCGFILPANGFYFAIDKGRNIGFRSSCKKCLNENGKFQNVEERIPRKEVLKRRREDKRKKTPISWAFKISYAEETREKDSFLQVRCKYCDRWFFPTKMQTSQRECCLIGQGLGESSFYCSSGCKKACPTFRMHSNEKSFKVGSSRESNPILRKIVLERDKYTCVNCGEHKKSVQLHCHHVIPATQNPMTANDPDVCITLCKKCHIEVHRKVGCKYHELRCI